MYHRRDLMFGEGARQRRAVEQVVRHQRTGNEAAMTCREIAINDGMAAGAGQWAVGMRFDIAGASCEGRSSVCQLT
jgi:hypothetical protein